MPLTGSTGKFERRCGWLTARAVCAVVSAMLAGACSSTVPSASLQSAVNLPVPASMISSSPAERLSSVDRGERYTVTPLSLIALAFDKQPDIKSSYERFRSEKGRYDFFYTSRDSLTPGLRWSNSFSEGRTIEDVTRQRDHTVEFTIEKQFFDTTELNVGIGYRTTDIDDDIGNSPLISADLRYPLWVSREKLTRTSEDIFRRNELDDVQLDYIQQIRRRLQDSLFRFHDVNNLKRQVDFYSEWLADLSTLGETLNTIPNRDLADDRRRLEAEVAKVFAARRNVAGRHEILVARLKAAIGIPFHARLEMKDVPFNPFTDQTHAELLQLSIETDPEIATLRNSMRNAEVQLDLARRGRWDLALLLSGESALEGRGEAEGQSDWAVSVGLDFRAVDPRVTDSLIRQATASINRFSQAIASRENVVFTDTLEPLVRIDTLSQSREDLIENLPRYLNDYQAGVRRYEQGSFNIDDLLKRRENVFDQQNEISRLKFLVGANVAELCTATGKYFELLKDRNGD